jgi:uncharacterized membrane protein
MPAASHAVVMAKRSVKVTRSCTVRRSASDLYAVWRDAINFHGVVQHPISITPISDTESLWVVSAPSGINTVEWYAVIITDQPNETIAWRSRDGAQIPNAGSVHFRPAPGDEGTEVTVELRYEPPAGRAGAWLAKLTGKEPGQQLGTTLRRFKALMETGEIPTIAGQPAGRPQRERERAAS